MVNNAIAIPVAEMIPIIRETTAQGKMVEMSVTGSSMLPLLKDRVSSVRLVKADDLKVGDIVLFQRNDDHYVLHRIIAIRGGVYDIVGDNQRLPDRNIPAASIIAKVSAYNRTGKRWETGDALYRSVLPAIKAAGYYGRKIKRKLCSFKKENSPV